MIALDACALNALLFHEPGVEVVAAHVRDSLVSAVNLAEVLERMARAGRAIDAVLDEILAFDVEIVSFALGDAILAASVARAGRRIGLSLGDLACVALGQERRIPVLTADRSWATMDLGVEVRLIR